MRNWIINKSDFVLRTKSDEYHATNDFPHSRDARVEQTLDDQNDGWRKDSSIDLPWLWKRIVEEDWIEKREQEIKASEESLLLPYRVLHNHQACTIDFVKLNTKERKRAFLPSSLKPPLYYYDIQIFSMIINKQKPTFIGMFLLFHLEFFNFTNFKINMFRRLLPQPFSWLASYLVLIGPEAFTHQTLLLQMPARCYVSYTSSSRLKIKYFSFWKLTWYEMKTL